MRKQLLSYKMGEFIGKNDKEQYKKPPDIGTKPTRNILSDKERLNIEQKKFAMSEAVSELKNKRFNKTKYHGKTETT